MNNELGRKNYLWIILAVFFVVAIVGGLAWYLIFKNGNDKTSGDVVGQSYKTEDWKNYQNSRYGFSLKYPPNFTTAESQNGDGITLTDKDSKITIRAYGSTNALSQDLPTYINWVRDNLFNESGSPTSAEEILAEDVTLGDASAKERQWKYIPSATNILTLTDQITALKNDTFYNLELEMSFANYDESAAHIFDNIVSSYRLN